MIRIKRAYEPPSRADGHRFLVERLWPRGMKKSALEAEGWIKDVAPSAQLRQWFSHRVERWKEFQRRYRKELDAHPETWAALLKASRKGTVTLLYSSRDEQHNAAVVLRAYLAEHNRSGNVKPPGMKPGTYRERKGVARRAGSRR